MSSKNLQQIGGSDESSRTATASIESKSAANFSQKFGKLASMSPKNLIIPAACLLLLVVQASTATEVHKRVSRAKCTKDIRQFAPGQLFSSTFVHISLADGLRMRKT